MDYRPVPTFNKNVYSSNGAVVVTKGAREIMAKNKLLIMSWCDGCCAEGRFQLTKSEMHSMRCVVDGLRLIHRDQRHVKDVLAHCVTLETYGPRDHVIKRPNEPQLSCHFILSGSVEVVYNMHKEDTSSDAIQIEKVPDDTLGDTTDSNINSITCTHSAGEYLAMLSLEGIDDGIAPPTKICTLEPTELIRIDTKDFHERLETGMARIRDEIKSIVHNPRCVLSAIPDDALEKILPHITRQRYPSHHPIIKQGEESNVMFCLAKGRCDVMRCVHVPEAMKDVSINLTVREPYDLFGQECLLTSSRSTCTVTTITPCLVLKINRLALDVVVKDHLHGILESTFPGYPSDEELVKIGYEMCLWNQYKYIQIRQHLMEVGAERLLVRPKTERVRRRPLSREERYPENLRRFILKGANFEPVTTRIRSAFIRRPKTPNTDKYMEEDRDSDTSVIRRVSSHNTIVGNNHDNNNSDRVSRPGSTRRRAMSAGREGKERVSKQITRNGKEIKPNSPYVNNNYDLRSPSYSSDEQNYSNMSDYAEDCELSSNSEKGDNSRPDALGIKPEPSATHYNPNFMRATVMVTLKTNEIIKKAKAVVEKNRFRTPARDESSVDEDDDDQWCTSIHMEHDRITRQITTDAERMSKIRRYLDSRAKQRQERLENIDVEGEFEKSTSCDHHSGDTVKKKDDKSGDVGGLEPMKGEREVQHHVASLKTAEHASYGVGDYCTSCLGQNGSVSGIPIVASSESESNLKDTQVLCKEDSKGFEAAKGEPSPENHISSADSPSPSTPKVEVHFQDRTSFPHNEHSPRQGASLNRNDAHTMNSRNKDHAKHKLAWAGNSQTSTNPKYYTSGKSTAGTGSKPNLLPLHTPPSGTLITSSTTTNPAGRVTGRIISRRGVRLRPTSAPVFKGE